MSALEGQDAGLERSRPRTGDIAARDAAAKLKAETKRQEIADMMRLHRASRAARTGDCALLSDLISEQASIVASKDFQGRTLVHVAAAAGQGDAIRLLAAQGADVDAQDSEGMAPLHVAAVNSQVAAAAALLENRADPLAVDSTGAPSGVKRLSLSSSSKRDDGEPQVSVGNEVPEGYGGRRAVFYAYRAGCPGLVEILRRAGAAAAAKTAQGGPPAAEAVSVSKEADPREDDPGMEGLDDQARGLFRLPVAMQDAAARRRARAEEEAAEGEAKAREEEAAKQVDAAVAGAAGGAGESKEGEEEQGEEEVGRGGSGTGPAAEAKSTPVRHPRASTASVGSASAPTAPEGGLSRAAPPPPVPHPAPGTYASPLRVRFELPGGDPDSVVFATYSPHEPAACGQVVAPSAPLVLVDPSAEDGMSGADLAAADAWLVARLGGGGGRRVEGRSRQDLYDDMVAMGSSASGAGGQGHAKTQREREAEAAAQRVSQAREALASISKDRRVPASAMEAAGLDARWDALEAVADSGIPLRNTMARVEALRARFRAGPQPPPEPAVLEQGQPVTADRRRRLQAQRQARTSETVAAGAVGSGARMQEQASAADAVVRGRKLGTAGVPHGDGVLPGPRSNPASAVAEGMSRERAAMVAEGALRVQSEDGGGAGSKEQAGGGGSKRRAVGGEQGLAPVEEAPERVAGDGVPVKRGTTRFVRAVVRSPDGRWSDVVTVRYRLLSPLEQFFDRSPKALWSAEGRLVSFGLTSLRRLMSADRGTLRKAFARIGILQRQSEALIQALKREWRKTQLKERESGPAGDGAAGGARGAAASTDGAQDGPDVGDNVHGATGDRSPQAGSTRGRGTHQPSGGDSSQVQAGGSGGDGDSPEPSVLLIGSTADAHIIGARSAAGPHELDGGDSQEELGGLMASGMMTGVGGPPSPLGRQGAPFAASPVSTTGSLRSRQNDLAGGSLALEQGSFAGSEVGLGVGLGAGGAAAGGRRVHSSPQSALRQMRAGGGGETPAGPAGGSEAVGPVRSLTSASAERLMARREVLAAGSAGADISRHVSFKS